MYDPFLKMNKKGKFESPISSTKSPEKRLLMTMMKRKVICKVIYMMYESNAWSMQ